MGEPVVMPPWDNREYQRGWDNGQAHGERIGEGRGREAAYFAGHSDGFAAAEKGLGLVTYPRREAAARMAESMAYAWQVYSYAVADSPGDREVCQLWLRRAKRRGKAMRRLLGLPY